MKLSRYQFEVLAYLEQSGEQVYAMRTLSDTLKISASAIGSSLDALAAEGLIRRKGETLAITQDGMAG